MDERCTERVEIDRPAELEIGDRTLCGLVYNLSIEGCMIDGADDACRVGDPVVLRLGDRIDSPGHIVWQRERHAGIRFAVDIDPGIVGELGFKPAAQGTTIEPWDGSLAPSLKPQAGTAGPATDCSEVSDLRQHRRVTVDRHVMCERNGSAQSVLLYDMSVGGCMFEFDDAVLAAGETVIMTLAASPCAAVVVWAIGNNAGARFCSELHAAVVEHYGFVPTLGRFDMLIPRDRFGRLLPPLPMVCK